MVIIQKVEGYDGFCDFINNFDSKGKTLHLYFTGSWCSDCIQAKPVIERSLEHASDKSYFVYVDVGDRPTLKMATVASKLIQSKDLVNFHVRMLFVVLKQLFRCRFGVNDIKIRNNQHVMVALTYSPKADTLRRKLGNLPVTCQRLNLDNDEDLLLLEQAMLQYQFNLALEEPELEERAAKTIKWLKQEDLETEAEKEERNEKCKKGEGKIKIFTKFAPSASSSSTSSIVAVLDDDAELFNDQRCHYEKL